MLCYHWLLSIHMCTCIFVFPTQGLSLDRAVFQGNYRPVISRIYKPTDVHTRTCTCTWCVSTWCTWVLDWWKCKVLVLDYEYLKYLSTWPIVLDPNPDCQSFETILTLLPIIWNHSTLLPILYNPSYFAFLLYNTRYVSNLLSSISVWCWHGSSSLVVPTELAEEQVCTPVFWVSKVVFSNYF